MADAKKRSTKAKQTKEAEVIAEAVPVEESVVEDSVTPTEVTEMAEEAAEQEQAVIADKRSSTAKAGKRSAKALAEVEEKQAKEARKATSDEEDDSKPKQPQKPTRSRLERRSKNFRKSAELIEKDKTYSLKEAIELAQKTSSVKFDATVELHINLSVDPRHADQNIRDNLVLPAGTGKTVRVAAFTDDKADGADISGVETILKQLERGTIDFDVLVATPANMAKLGKYARVLGPRGLMPNPKSGTVTTDVAKAIQEAKAGRVEYRVDSTGIVHLGVGKVSFKPAELLNNVEAVLASIRANKPNSVKGTFIKSVYLTTSMGPSIVIDVAA
jgi:large subunit ribosomal protein L1